MPLSLDHIRTFHAVAEHGSLLAAARHLGRTQPAIGRQVTLLEEALGYRLFERSREGMRLTGKGADLVAIASEVMDNAAAFERAASGLEEAVAGTVRISANEIVGALLLPGLLAEFMRDTPGIEIEVEISNAEANLLRRDADIAIRMFRPTQNDLVARKVRDLPLGLFAARSYLDRTSRPVVLADLAAHVLIGQDRNPSLLRAYRAVGLDLSPGGFPFRCDNNIAGIEAVRAGIGIGPLHVEMAARWPEVERVLEALPVPTLELWLACHADVRHNRRIRLVMDFLAERLKSPYAALRAG